MSAQLWQAQVNDDPAVRVRQRRPHHAAGDSAVQSEAYKSKAVTEIREYDGYAHLLPAQKGWEQIADDVLDWAVEQSRQAS